MIQKNRLFGSFFLVCIATSSIRSLLAEVPSQLFRAEGQHGRNFMYYFPDDEQARITASDGAVTPHIVWTKPFAGRTLRVLAIAHQSNGRWPVELAQRFDFQITTVYAAARDRLGVRPTDRLHGSAGRVNQRPSDVEARLLAAMHEPIDVIINDLPLATLGEKVSRRLAQTLKNGVGYVGPCEGLKLETYERSKGAERAMIHGAVPLRGLEALTEAFESEQHAAGKLLKLWQNAQGGRLADATGFPWESGDRMDPQRLQYPWLVDMQWEAWCSLTAKAAYWTAGSWPGPRAADTIGVSWPGEPIDRSQLPQKLSVEYDSTESITMGIWDADSRPRHVGEGLTVPRLPAGRYFVSVQRGTPDGRIADWSFGTIAVTADTRIVSVELDDPHKQPDETMRAVVTLGDKPEEGSTIQLEVIDNYGRCISQGIVTARRRIQFTADLRESLHIYNYVNAILMGSDNLPIDEKRHAFYIRQPAPARDDLITMISDASGAPLLHKRITYDQYTEHGMNAHVGGEHTLTLSNTHPVHVVTRLKGVRVQDDGTTSPNLASPDHIAGTQRRMQSSASQYDPFSPLFYYLGDDVRYVGYGADAGWSPEARESLGRWAKQTYGTIEQLNEAWGTSYTDYSQAEPIKYAEMRVAIGDAGRARYRPFCHWVDHQLHQDQVFTGFFRSLGVAINEVAPDVPSNIGCFTQGWSRPGSGFDFWKLAENKQIAFQYPNPWVHEIFRCALAPDALQGVWYGGYGIYNYPPYYFDQDYLPWWGVFHSVNLHGLYIGGYSHNYGVERLLGADLTPLPGPAKIFANHKELKRGIAKTLFNARRLGDGIAVVYAPSAIHASVVFEDGLPRDPQWEGQETASHLFIYMQCWEGMKYLIRDLGLSFDVVPASHLRNGQFLDGEFRVLILPLHLRVTDAEAQTIRRFVKEGGLLIADALPGLFNGSCHADHAGVLADVFGVNFSGGIPRQRVRREPASLGSDTALPKLSVDSGMELSGAQAMGSTESGTPIFTVNQYGRGTAILLNVLARDYQIWRTAATEMSFRDGFGKLLAEAGVDPYPVKCVVNQGSDREHPIQVSETHRYELDGAQYVGLLRHPKLRPDDALFMADLRPKPVWITFDRKWHVYEMRGGMYRGHTDTVEDIIYPARAELYALLPYQVADVKLSAESSDHAIVLSGKVVPEESEADSVTHVVHVEIVDPTGRHRREFTRNILARKGQFQQRFFVGFNAPRGKWAISVRDAATGMTRHVSVDL